MALTCVILKKYDPQSGVSYATVSASEWTEGDTYSDYTFVKHTSCGPATSSLTVQAIKKKQTVKSGCGCGK